MVLARAGLRLSLTIFVFVVVGKMIKAGVAGKKLDSTKSTVVKYNAIAPKEDLMLGYIWFNEFTTGLKPFYGGC